MDEIQGNNNCVTTECGHKFHCSCLMKNAVINGFSCPYCREQMAEQANNQDDDEDDDETWGQGDDDDDTWIDHAYSSHALNGARWLFQRAEGEEIDEDDEDDDYDEDNTPPLSHVAQKLREAGITFEDLVKASLIEHDEYNSRYSDDEMGQLEQDIFNRISLIIRNYRENPEPDPMAEIPIVRIGVRENVDVRVQVDPHQLSHEHNHEHEHDHEEDKSSLYDYTVFDGCFRI